ncbi:hypothetical protein CFC21_085547 [Triticum aestivum]|uniref:BAG domain-containing protein n=2 Tax=Triticum aestivum TaxID=4565 RepID=A0A3B6NXZ2_WHEAT|nr:uncharacterized protein LOC123129129 [Triticum aestivum]KAF7081625.1 hypothetical protein CFC21_085547 [Triticum aestivum]
MAHRGGFFGYDPYDYYYPTSYGYDAYPYYRPAAADPFFPDVEPLVTEQLRPARRRAPARHDDGFFRGFGAAEPPARTTARPRPGSGSPKSCPDCFEVEVTGPDSDSPPAIPEKQAPSVEEAAVRVQAAARGLLARRMVREVRAVERQAEAVAARVAAEAEALRADARARIGLGEELMRLLLRLDGVRGAREYRRRVTRRVLALHDAVDALEATPTMVAADVPEVQDAEEEAESGMEPELSVEDNTASDFLAAETTDMAAMEVDATSPVVVDEAGQNETELVAESEKASEAEGEWEMVATGDGDVSTGEEDPAPPKAQQQQQQEQAHEEKKTVTTDGLDANKLMEMVTALCERSAQQCALIGALAERVDTLERAVRRVEEADRRRRRNKKTNKDGKKNTSSFYND